MGSYMKRLTKTGTVYSPPNRKLGLERRIAVHGVDSNRVAIAWYAVETVNDEIERVEIEDGGLILTRDAARELVEKLHEWSEPLAP